MGIQSGRISAQVTLRVCDGKDVELVFNQLVKLQAMTRSEAGCLRFDLFQWRSDPRFFTLIEVFKDEAAFATHLRATYTQAYFALNMTIVVDKMEIEEVPESVEA